MFASNKTADIMKGMGIGLAVGSAATFASTMMMSKSGRKTCKKNAAKCMRTVEDMMNSISSMR